MTGLGLAFSIILGLGGLFTPIAADAQQAAKVARIGYLGGDPAAAPQLREAFLRGLSDLGYIEGRNLEIVNRSAQGKLERLPGLASELVTLKVDVILATGGTPAIRRQASDRDHSYRLSCGFRSDWERARH